MSATVIALTAVHAREIQALADRFYPTSFRMTAEDIAENLEGLQEEDCNFCFGVEEDGRLVGYLMAWLDNSLVEGRAEDVVLVDDICLERGHRSYLYPLLKAMARALDEAGYRGIPIEGTARKQAEQTFISHPEVIESLGYRMAANHEYTDESLRETLVWVRFESVAEPDYLAPEDRYEVELPEVGA
ncbi:MAG: hypothetical protein HY319_27155 [Armatimonadetes bacterium]|nr:hypothetical protein [Armatimonadota bacterium]